MLQARCQLYTGTVISVVSAAFSSMCFLLNPVTYFLSLNSPLKYFVLGLYCSKYNTFKEWWQMFTDKFVFHLLTFFKILSLQH